MTNLGVLAFGLGLLAVIIRRDLIWWLLAIAAAFPASAVVIAAGNAVNPFYFYALATILTVALTKSQRPLLPGQLVAFTGISAVVTLLGPGIFAGTLVSPSKPGATSFLPLGYTTSNLAQIVYLFIGIALVGYIATLRHDLSRLVVAAFGIGTALSTLRYVTYLSGLPFPGEFINNAPGVRYIDTNAEGEYRLRGIFAEPSELSVFSIGALAFFLSAAARSEGRRRVGHLLLAACCVLNLSVSNSATAAVALILVAVVALLVLLRRFLFGRARAPLWALMTAPGILILTAVFWTQVTAPFSNVLGEKLGSNSYESRSGLDLQALEVVARTWGVGVGLGANRPSSFLTSLLSCVGIVGTLVLTIYLWRVGSAAWRTSHTRPAAWGLIGVLTAKIVASPDLSTPILWLLIGVCTQAYFAAGTTEGGTVPPDDTPSRNARGVRPAPMSPRTQLPPDGVTPAAPPVPRLRRPIDPTSSG